MAKEYTRALTTLGIIPIAGQIILHDDFEQLLKFTQLLGEGDSIFELDPSLCKQGSQSLHLKTRTAEAAIGDAIQANTLTHLLPSKILTFIGSFRLPSNTTPAFLQFAFTFDDGSVAYVSAVNFNPNTPDWEYQTTGSALISIPGSDIQLAPLCWHQVILKIDFATKKYISFSVDNLFADLSSIALDTTGSASQITFTPAFTIETAGAAPTEVNFDEFIIHEI